MQRFLFTLPVALAVVLGLLLSAAMSSARVAAQPAAPVEARAETHTAHDVSGDLRSPALDPALLAATDVIIELSGFTFLPTVVTIEPGQTVTWVRRSGAHNVAADDGSYRSGPVGSDWDTFSHTFTEAGESRYYCEQHGGPGGSGMSGMVIVQVSGQAEQKLYLPLIAQ